MSDQTIEVICRICGQPLTVQAPGLDECEGALRETLLRMATNATHEPCLRSFQSNRLEQERIALAELRTQAWGGICPPLYQHTDPARLRVSTDKPERFRSAVEWAYGPKGLGLFGTSGGGKTRTIYIVLKREFVAGRSIAAMTHTEFSGEAVRMARSDFKGEQDRWLRLMKRVDILFLDDLGKSRFTNGSGESKHAEEVLWDVAEYRFTNLLPFFFSCNLRDGDALAGSMSDDKGKPFVRRLREFCEILPF
jgi:DNA replication protein DnaC